MDTETIFQMIERAEKSSFNKITIEISGVKLSLERTSDISAASLVSTAAAPVKTTAQKREHDADDYVFAPISGVFYVAKEPGAEPFVKSGSIVNKGDVLCIVEAMKTMNEITAPKAGVIESVLKKDTEAIVAKDALFKYAR